MRINNFASQFLVRNQNRPFHIKQTPSDLEQNSRQVSGLNGLIHNTVSNGKASSSQDRIQSLMDRKQTISDMKQEYAENAKKSGVSDKVIEEQLKSYDTMLEELDAEVIRVQQEEQEKNAQQAEKGGKSAQKDGAAKAAPAPKNAQQAAVQANADLISDMTKLSQGKQAVHAVETSKHILKGQALSMTGSPTSAPASEKTRKKGIESNANAEALTGRVFREAAKMRDTAQEMTQTSSHDTGASVRKKTGSPKAAETAAEASPKTYEQQAAENYQKIAASAGGEQRQENAVDLFV